MSVLTGYVGAAVRRAHPQLVARPARVPNELTKRPFSLGEARTAGVTLSALRGRTWRRLGSQLYSWTKLSEDHWKVLGGWRKTLPPDAVFAGATAAWISGLDVSPCNPVEIAVPKQSGVRSRDGLRVRRCEISRDEMVSVRGLQATTLNRALSDLCLRWSTVEALIAIDMALSSKCTDKEALRRYCEGAKGRAGSARMRALVQIAAAAESPMETRLRWLLLRRGMPRPEVQAQLCDEAGRFVGRADLYYPTARLVVEFDGGNHRERLVSDDRRQNLLISAGFQVLRFTAADLYQHPDIVEAQVRGALGYKRAEFDARRRASGPNRALFDIWRG